MKKIFSPVMVFLAGIGTAALLFSVMSFDNEKQSPQQPVNNEKGHHWYAPPLPQAIEFAGEKVPVERWEVKEQLDREVLFNYYWESNVLYMLKLAGRYFPLIEARLKENGVPDDF